MLKENQKEKFRLKGNQKEKNNNLKIIDTSEEVYQTRKQREYI